MKILFKIFVTIIGWPFIILGIFLAIVKLCYALTFELTLDISKEFYEAFMIKINYILNSDK